MRCGHICRHNRRDLWAAAEVIACRDRCGCGRAQVRTIHCSHNSTREDNMVSLAQLWLPIVVAAVLVFVASSVIHMVLQWHKPFYKGFANEADVRAALGKSMSAPGIYIVPFCNDMKQMSTPEMMAKFTEGPIAK